MSQLQQQQGNYRSFAAGNQSVDMQHQDGEREHPQNNLPTTEADGETSEIPNDQTTTPMAQERRQDSVQKVPWFVARKFANYKAQSPTQQSLRV